MAVKKMEGKKPWVKFTLLCLLLTLILLVGCVVVITYQAYVIYQNDLPQENGKEDLKELEERIGQVWITNLRRPFTTFNSEDSIEQHEPHPAFIYKSSV